MDIQKSETYFFIQKAFIYRLALLIYIPITYALNYFYTFKFEGTPIQEMDLLLRAFIPPGVYFAPLAFLVSFICNNKITPIFLRFLWSLSELALIWPVYYILTVAFYIFIE
ncbi:hypothetical protein [Leptospira interrogans]|uniref:hypothetical protein n=1 Tax=Leptospira interrogans TaxID=173 RepID=UPI000772D638|nr:hypothetical protein [Leptospira interrogans]